jgi:hypothetical protein
LTLIRDWRDRLRILRRRLFPMNFPVTAEGAFLRPEQLTPSRRVRQAARQARYAAGRVWYHARSLFGFLRALALWFWDRRS